jgi:GT2 family glycosyltransferase
MGAAHSTAGTPPAFSIVIANWNGEAFLARCLSSVLLSARESGRPFEVIVVDDGSTDGSDEMVGRRFPQIRLIARPENRGFAITVNEGVEAAKGSIVILLNNDVVVRTDFCSCLLSHFEGGDDSLFGVTAKTIEWDGHESNFVKMDAVWRRGDFRLVWADPNEAAATHFLQAGACAVRRDRFLELGGLAPVFAPGYWEDFDLAWRALACGWRNLYDPRSPVMHLGKASFRRRFGEDEVGRLVRRNAWLFSWLNLSDPALLLSHCGWLPVRIAREALAGRVDLFRGLLRALPRTGEVLRLRRARAGLRRVGDREILAAVDTTASQRSEA